MKRPSVDPKSFELAEHFLSDLEGDEAGEDLTWELAKVIQDAVESWFADPMLVLKALRDLPRDGRG
jgi:hypothetical protein